MKEYICSCEIISKRSFLNRKIKAYSKEDAVTKFIEYIKKEYNIFVFSSSVNVININEIEIIE